MANGLFDRFFPTRVPYHWLYGVPQHEDVYPGYLKDLVMQAGCARLLGHDKKQPNDCEGKAKHVAPGDAFAENEDAK